MIAVYQKADIRFVAEAVTDSAADAQTLSTPAVPAQTLRTVLFGMYYPSATETQTVAVHKVSRSGAFFTLINSMSVAGLGPTAQGMYRLIPAGQNELVLFPGESIRVARAAATAGSTMKITLQYIDTVLPFVQRTFDPQSKIIRRAWGAGGGGGGGEGGGGEGGGGEGGEGGGGGGGGEPI